jgi:hypothetical protein
VTERSGLVVVAAMACSLARRSRSCSPWRVIRLDGSPTHRRDNIIEVAMPLGLYTGYQVSAPCGLCSTEGIVGLLDVPDHFLDPSRMQASLVWFGCGCLEYKFPNNAKILDAEIAMLDFSMELSLEVPGTNSDWPSDISLWSMTVWWGRGHHPATSAISGAFTRRVGGSWKARNTASSRPGGSLTAAASWMARGVGHPPRSKHPGGVNNLRPRLRQLRSGHPDAHLPAR